MSRPSSGQSCFSMTSQEERGLWRLEQEQELDGEHSPLPRCRLSRSSHNLSMATSEDERELWRLEEEEAELDRAIAVLEQVKGEGEEEEGRDAVHALLGDVEWRERLRVMGDGEDVRGVSDPFDASVARGLEGGRMDMRMGMVGVSPRTRPVVDVVVLEGVGGLDKAELMAL
ncbi:hypothetical protein LZ554_005228 [Drepanopeziza brunnea f. sp. 'monogermtubi']|nr:hypothetical protein LZ554_005228 [Drepanopeziza brunnea f. sp. 'monogermtubi']